MERIMGFLEGSEPVSIPPSGSAHPTNLPRTFKPDPDKLLEIYYKQQAELAQLRGQNQTLNEQTIRLEKENTKLHEILNDSQDPVLKKSIENIFKAVQKSPDFEKCLNERLKQEKKEPYLHVVIETIETLLKEEVNDIVIPESFKQEFKEDWEEWNWMLSEEKIDIRKCIDQYKTTLELLGTKMDLTPVQFKALLTEIAELAKNPAKTEEMNNRLLQIAEILGNVLYGSFKVLLFVYTKTSHFKPVIRFFTSFTPWPVRIFFGLFGL